MRAFRTVLSVVMMTALLAAMTPVVAGGAKAGNGPAAQRLPLDSDVEIREFGDEAEAQLTQRPAPEVASERTAAAQSAAEDTLYAPGEVLVKFREDTSLDAASQARVHSRVGADPARGVGATQRIHLVELDETTSVEEGVAAYESQAEVEWAQPNYIYHLDSNTPNDIMVGWQYQHHNTGQTNHNFDAFGDVIGPGVNDADMDTVWAWESYTGDSSAVVAIIDTGIDADHPDLAGNLWSNPGEIPGNGTDDDGNTYIDDTYGWDFVNDDKTPADGHSHGTHVAGIIGAVGDNSRGVAGVSWDVSLMVLKSFNDSDNATATSGALVEAIEYADDNGADVINASWGEPAVPDNAVRTAIEAADLLFVAAAGNDANDNDSTPYYPASYDLDNIISVAASDDRDQLASFSNYGATEVDVAAPGVHILSTVPELSYSGQSYMDGGWGDMHWDTVESDNGWLTSEYASKPWVISSVDRDPDRHGTISGAPSMSNRWYHSEEEAYLDVRYPLDLSSTTSATAIFDMYLDVEYGYDHVLMIASTDNGTTWEAVDGDLSGQGDAFTGTTTEPITIFMNLEDYLGEGRVLLSFVIVSDDSNNAEGVHIDDFEVLSYGGYGYMSGTSMAAPQVAGIAALLKSYAPSLTTADIKELILDNVDWKSALTGKVATGGRVNANKAIDNAPAMVKRLAGQDRYATAVEIAREGFDPHSDKSWRGVDGSSSVDAIIIASGDDRFAADPLTAAGLVWAYDAPMLLVAQNSTPNDVKRAVDEIVEANGGTARAYFVGGNVSTPYARFEDLRDYVQSNSGGTLNFTRIAGADRYQTARAIAGKVTTEYESRNSGDSPPVVLCANGADNRSFVDALALSPIAAQNGFPIIPVGRDFVPAASEQTLRDIGPDAVVIGGGTAVVYTSTENEIEDITGVNAQRLAGADRYRTATAIATYATDGARDWLVAEEIGVAANLPDALSGGSMVGSKNGVLLLTTSSSLPSVSESWIESHPEATQAYVFGGTATVKTAVVTELNAAMR